MIRALALAVLSAASLQAHALMAKSFIVTDIEGHAIIAKDPDTVRPIASLTKLVTAERASRHDPDELIAVTEADFQAGRTHRTVLRAGFAYSRSTLMSLALVFSDNVAAEALARTTTAIEPLPLVTRVVDGCGLDPRNAASARSIAALVRRLYPTKLAAMSVAPNVPVGDAVAKNSNPLIGKPGWEFLLSKTGWTRAAGGAVASVIMIKGRPMVIVLLGSSSVRQRWVDLAEIREGLGDGDFEHPKGYSTTSTNEEADSPPPRKARATGNRHTSRVKHARAKTRKKR